MFDQMDRIVRQANPVPDMMALDSIGPSVLLLDEQRSEGMQTQKRVDIDPGPKPPRRNWTIGIAAAAAVIIVGEVLMVSRADSGPAPVTDEPVATTQPLVVEAQPSPEAVAAGFLEARTMWDFDAAVGYLSEDATIDIGPADSQETLGLEMAWQRATGLVVTFDECASIGESVAGEPTSVSCAVTVDGAIAGANGIDPYQASFEFEALDGMITNVTFSDLGSYSREDWEPFASWVLEEHSDAIPAMYQKGLNSSPVLTQESFDLWRRYTEEYVDEAAEQLAFGFLEAREVWDATKALSHLSETSSVSVGPANDPETLRLEMDWQNAIGLVISPNECSTSGVFAYGKSIAVSCEVAIDGQVGRSNGVQPYSGRYQFEVLDGIITSVVFGNLGSFNESEWAPFSAWVSTNHPDDKPVMYTGDRHRGAARLTQESFDLWRKYTQEYVAERASN